MRFKNDLGWADVTKKADFINRRNLMLGGAGALLGTPALARIAASKSIYSTKDTPTSLKDITSYNNYYEFGTDKSDPARYASALTTSPWSIKIDGLVDKPGDYTLAEVVDGAPMEERIYRLRCVEGWSMVVPWTGFELSYLLNRIGVQSGAKYVRFETIVRPSEMRGQQSAVLDWPYVEGLRLDEAMNPLTILATGIYGEKLLNQNGAPIRLVVPWKYGFKSIKSISRISLTKTQPKTSWNEQNASEYGFYSNVNPNVNHPRWSQASEREIGAGLFAGRVDTKMFNGYGEYVASMYAGQDLSKDF